MIVLDLPGCGLSRKPEHGYSADSMALSVMRLPNQLGLEPAALVTPPALASPLDSSGQTWRPRGLVVAYFRALIAMLTQFDFHHLSRERAARLSVPTLVVWGARDPFVPNYAQDLLAMLPRARLAIVPRSWHRPRVERPLEVVGFIEEFLDEIGAASPPPAH